MPATPAVSFASLFSVPQSVEARRFTVQTVVAAVFIIGGMTTGAFQEARGQQAPSTCEDRLDKAETAYRNRNFDEAAALASECTDLEVVDEPTARRAYRLIGLVYLRQDRRELARAAIANLLRIDPSYSPDPVDDPPAFLKLVRSVRQEIAMEGQPEAQEQTESEEQLIPDEPVRDGGTFFLKGGIGASDYTGDWPAEVVSHPFDFQEFQTGNGVPFLFTGELGYQHSPKWAFVLGFQGGNFPIVGFTGRTIEDSQRYTPQFLVRYTFGDPSRTLSPYIDGGFNATFGGGPSASPGFGPSVGGGVDIALSASTSFFVESRFNFTFPDDAIDAVSPETRGPAPLRDPVPFDMVNQLLGIGVKVTL